MRPIICVDMDEVIADALGEHLVRYNRDFGRNVTVEDLRGRWLGDLIPAAHLPTVEQYILADDFFSVLDVMPESQRVLERLQSRYDIFIATAAMEVPSSFTPKFNWLARHFPFIPTSHIVFCGDKSILRGDYLIDDNPRQLKRFMGRDPEEKSQHTREGDSPREGILFTSPANANVTGFRRVNNWLDVENMFLG
jgi:5'(3')-deoxyribonucleotidase